MREFIQIKYIFYTLYFSRDTFRCFPCLVSIVLATFILTFVVARYHNCGWGYCTSSSLFYSGGATSDKNSVI